MHFRTALGRGLETVPDCRAVCYVDLTSGLVLASSLRSYLPQEQLNLVATVGADLIESGARYAAAGPSAAAGGCAPSIVTVHGKTDLFVYVRLKEEDAHMLCYCCGPDAGSGQVMDAVLKNCAEVSDLLG